MVRNVLYLFPLECFLGMETEMIGFLHCYPSLTEELVENEVRRLLRCLDEREGVVTLQSLKEVHLKRLGRYARQRAADAVCKEPDGAESGGGGDDV